MPQINLDYLKDFVSEAEISSKKKAAERGQDFRGGVFYCETADGENGLREEAIYASSLASSSR